MRFTPSRRHPLITLSLLALCLVTFLPGADVIHDLNLVMKAAVWVYYDGPPILKILWPRIRTKLIAPLLVAQLSQSPVEPAFGTSRVPLRRPVAVVEFRICRHPDFDQEALWHDGQN